MKFINTFLCSVYKFDGFHNLIKMKRLRAAIGYFIVVTVVLGLAAGIFPTIEFFKTIDKIEKEIPEFRIENGEFIAEDSYFFDIGDYVVVLEPERESCDEINTEDYANGIFVSKSDMLAKSAGISREMSFSETKGSGVVLTDETLYDMCNKLFLICLVIVFILYIIYMLILLLFFALIAKLISNILRGGLRFKECFKAAAYCMTFPMVLYAVVMWLGFSMPNIVFAAIVCVYIYFAVKNCKEAVLE